jgi:hypothetical protein
MTSEKNWKKKVKEIFSKYESKIVIFLGMVLMAVIAFEAGILQGQKWQKDPMIVEVPAVVAANSVDSGNANQAENVSAKTESGTPTENINQKNPAECVFVGSKNSNKYHIPTCSYAKRIKPENIVCFKDKADAEMKGYVADKCVK